jgi:hypothetical protein
VESLAEKTIRSFKQVTDFPFYTASYFADYRLDQFTDGTIRRVEDIPGFFERIFREFGYPVEIELAGKRQDSIGCSAFAARSREGNRVIGKNLDWRAGPVLLLRTFPIGGYSSLSLVDLSHFDLFGLQSSTHSLLTAPYVPFDGMNDQGLVITMLSVQSNCQYPPPSGKTPIGDFNAIRVVLDRCRSVDEAIEVFLSYDIIQSGPLPIHYLISDTNETCVLELSDGKVRVLRTTKVSVVTNFLTIENPDFELERENCERYQRITRYLNGRPGWISVAGAKQLLREVSVFQPGYAVPSTIWSVVFLPDELKLTVRIGDHGVYYRVGLTDAGRV